MSHPDDLIAVLDANVLYPVVERDKTVHSNLKLNGTIVAKADQPEIAV